MISETDLHWWLLWGQCNLADLAEGSLSERSPMGFVFLHGPTVHKVQPFPIGIRRDFLLLMIDDCIKGIITYPRYRGGEAAFVALERWRKARNDVMAGDYDQIGGGRILRSALTFWYQRENHQNIPTPHLIPQMLRPGAVAVYPGEPEYNGYTESRYRSKLRDLMKTRVLLYKQIVLLLSMRATVLQGQLQPMIELQLAELEDRLFEDL